MVEWIAESGEGVGLGADKWRDIRGEEDEWKGMVGC